MCVSMGPTVRVLSHENTAILADQLKGLPHYFSIIVVMNENAFSCSQRVDDLSIPIDTLDLKGEPWCTNEMAVVSRLCGVLFDV